MADYWKSQPRKFCQYCKCWIADNKPSIDFHERGKNHKENVAAKIAEIKKKSVKKAKQDEQACKQFAAMEEAALKAYEEDLKRMQREEAFGATETTTSTPSTYQPVPMVPAPKQPQCSRSTSEAKPPKPPKPHKNKSTDGRAAAPPRPQTGAWSGGGAGAEAVAGSEAGSDAGADGGAGQWVEGKSDEGYTYYYNTVTGESRWENPEQTETTEKKESSAKPKSSQPVRTEVWTKAVSPEGYTYYYNSLTGESSWEKPSDNAPPGTTDVYVITRTKSPEEEEGENTESAEHTEGEENTRKRKAEDDNDEEPGEQQKEKEKEEEAEATVGEEEESPSGRFRPKNPYGTWERIKVNKDPYASVDWQLPQVQTSEECAPVEVPPEPKHKFKTRVITSLGDTASSAPVTFKKKTQNGKSRSLRQRDHDD